MVTSLLGAMSRLCIYFYFVLCGVLGFYFDMSVVVWFNIILHIIDVALIG